MPAVRINEESLASHNAIRIGNSHRKVIIHPFGQTQSNSPPQGCRKISPRFLKVKLGIHITMKGDRFGHALSYIAVNK
jgi:hypothetical protein